jgi:hypothetical protein
MASPTSTAQRGADFIHYNPRDSRTGNTSEHDSESGSDYDSDGSENEDITSKKTDISVKECLDMTLQDIRAGKLDLRVPEQLEQFESDFGDVLTGQTDDTHELTALHILADTKKDQLPESSRLKPLVELLVKRPENLLARKARGGFTAIFVAIWQKKDRMVRWMCTAAHPHTDAILKIKNHEGKNCLHEAIESRSKCADILVQYAEPDTLCARDQNGNSVLHLAVQYEQCRKEQLPIIQAMVAKCDKLMSMPGGGLFNNARNSPYRHHIETCEVAEAERGRRQKEDEKKRMKEELDKARDKEKGNDKAKDNPTSRGHAELDDGNVRDNSRKHHKTRTRFGDGQDMAGIRRRGTGNLDNDALGTLGGYDPELIQSKYGTRPTEDSSTRSTQLVDYQEGEAGRKREADQGGKKSGQTTKPSSSKQTNKGDQSSRVNEETIKPIRHFLKLHYLRERGHDAALEILYGRDTTSGMILTPPPPCGTVLVCTH